MIRRPEFAWMEPISSDTSLDDRRYRYRLGRRGQPGPRPGAGQLPPPSARAAIKAPRTLPTYLDAREHFGCYLPRRRIVRAWGKIPTLNSHWWTGACAPDQVGAAEGSRQSGSVTDAQAWRSTPRTRPTGRLSALARRPAHAGGAAPEPGRTDPSISGGARWRCRIQTGGSDAWLGLLAYGGVEDFDAGVALTWAALKL